MSDLKDPRDRSDSLKKALARRKVSEQDMVTSGLMLRIDQLEGVVDSNLALLFKVSKALSEIDGTDDIRRMIVIEHKRPRA